MRDRLFSAKPFFNVRTLRVIAEIGAVGFYGSLVDVESPNTPEPAPETLVGKAESHPPGSGKKVDEAVCHWSPFLWKTGMELTHQMQQRSCFVPL
jgi:hypothetical protein